MAFKKYRKVPVVKVLFGKETKVIKSVKFGSTVEDMIIKQRSRER